MKKGRRPGHKEKLLVVKRPLEEKEVVNFPGNVPEDILRKILKGLDVVALRKFSKVNRFTAHITHVEIDKIVDEQARAMAKHARKNQGRNEWPRAIPYPFPALCFSCGTTIFAPHLYVKHPKRRGKLFYPTGCTHEEYDGEPWCSGCCTLVLRKKRAKVFCTECAGLDWGKRRDRNIKFATLEGPF